MSSQALRIACIGAGYVGGPTMAMIAAKCPEHTVTVVDVNKDRIAQWNSDRLPIYEPGLDELVKSRRGVNLFYSTDIPKAIDEADIVFISVNTPTKDYGVGIGCSTDLSHIIATAKCIRENSRSGKVIVEKSTVPVRTAESLDKILNSNRDGLHFPIVSNPEFLAEGTAIKDLELPSRVLIGGNEPDAVQKVVDIYRHWVDEGRIVTTSLWSSELSKLTSNAMLAQRVSSVNALSALCEATGADIDEVSRVAGMDPRIGSRFLKAGIGFGGSCFKKDLLNLIYLCKHFHLDPAARYWEGVLEINEWQKSRFVEGLLHEMLGTLAGRKVAVLGTAFKADTGDTRESPAIDIVRRLLDERAVVSIYDPKAGRLDLGEMPADVEYVKSAYDACKGSEALIVLTDWDEFKHLDYKTIHDSMQSPAHIFDGRNCIDHDRLVALGFIVHRIGKPRAVGKPIH